MIKGKNVVKEKDYYDTQEEERLSKNLKVCADIWLDLFM